MTLRILVRGSGDLGSGVVVRLYRAGWKILIAELENPVAVRRSVAFANAVYQDTVTIEGIKAKKITQADEIFPAIRENIVPVMIDADARTRFEFKPHVIVDARMIKRQAEKILDCDALLIGIGPGFMVGENCHAVIESMRGHSLGRVYWQGSALEDTGLPEEVANHKADRVLRSPMSGVVKSEAKIGDKFHKGEIICFVGEKEILAPFDGILRGLIATGVFVEKDTKIGDVDPRVDFDRINCVSDKALAVGGGVLEAILSTNKLRPILYQPD